MDNTGGPITIGVLGNDAGESGIIAATGDGIVIDNSANVTVSGIEINNAAGCSGVLVKKDDDGHSDCRISTIWRLMTATFGIEVDGQRHGHAAT